MSDGHYCFVRDLGPVKGGKGMKHHEVVVDFNLRGMAKLFKRALARRDVEARPASLWRWRELLPLPDPRHVVSLGEVETPLIELTNSARPAGFAAPVVKDEGRLPTGSFKARGLALAVSMAQSFGVRRVAIPTNGNAGAAMAAYAARAGMEAFCFCPDDTPEINLSEIALQGATVWRVNGLINDCARLVAAGKERFGWFDMSTLKEPYRIEGKKTMGLELAAQMQWRLPDVVFYPTGGGTGLIGMWKGWQELAALGAFTVVVLTIAIARTRKRLD